ncbi:MAG: hypothetical protein ACEPO2_12805 [Pelagibaca sp.]
MYWDEANIDHRELTARERQRLTWMMASLSLPKGGVRAAFADEMACVYRFAAVRWPEGPTCADCGRKDFAYLKMRKCLYCRKCKRQLSVTAGTIAHRSRLDLRMWFIAAEDVISAYAIGKEDAFLTGHDLAHRYGVSYSAAHRLKTRLLADLSDPKGIIKPSICVAEPNVPQDVAEFDWGLFVWAQAKVTGYFFGD